MFSETLTTSPAKIVVVGSSNTDMVVRVPHFPHPGETIMGSNFMTAQGGKGANQAVAVQRMGGRALFVACLGNDIFGRQSLASLESEGIDVRHVRMVDGVASGVALIPVDAQAENCIIVAAGANACLIPDDVQAAAQDIRSARILLMQLETPLDALTEAARIAHEAGVTVVLNPAPYQPLPSELLQNVDIIIPNETEASQLAGVEVTDEASAMEAIGRIQALGVNRVIITMGRQGAATSQDGRLVRVPTRAVQAVDTTAAGDTFCGAFCVALTHGCSVTEAMAVGNKAAAMAVTRMGAQPSIPTATEVFRPDNLN